MKFVMNDYTVMSRHQLEARLKLADDVCTLIGWTSVNMRDGMTSDSDWIDAGMQLWMMWAAEQPSGALTPINRPELIALVPQLAVERRGVREACLAKIKTLVWP